MPRVSVPKNSLILGLLQGALSGHHDILESCRFIVYLSVISSKGEVASAKRASQAWPSTARDTY
jgi:hypothetical protein